MEQPPHPVRASGYSIQGRKPSQEDSWYISPQTFNGRLVLVADGVGGHSHGDYASQHCISVFRESYEADPMIVDVGKYLLNTARQVSQEVFQKGESEIEYSGSGTTLTGFHLSGDMYHLINIGDSRVYLFDRKERLQRLTRDHSIVQQLLDTGKLTEEQALAHPQRNIILSAIGQDPLDIKIDIYGPYRLFPGEILLAFSDGVHDALNDEEICEVILNHRQNPELCSLMVNAAYDAGGKDNITACCYRY